MDLKSAVEVLKEKLEDTPLNEKQLKASEVVFSFCQTAVKLQESGIPINRFPNETRTEGGYCVGYKDCYDEWIAWLAKMLDVERIIQEIKGTCYKTDVKSRPFICLYEEDIPKLATDIVNSILVKE